MLLKNFLQASPQNRHLETKPTSPSWPILRDEVAVELHIWLNK